VIADQNGPEIRKVTTDGTINVVVSGYSATSVQVDGSGNVYFTSNNAVYKASPAGVVTTIAGGSSGYYGDGGPATLAKLASPSGLALDGAGNIYIADTNNYRVRQITPDGNIKTIAGNGTCGFAGDGAVFPNYTQVAQFNHPRSVAIDSSGNIFVGEQSHIRRIQTSTGGRLTTYAGGAAACIPDGVQALFTACIYNPSLAVDRSGNVYFTDATNARVRTIDHGNGTVKTVAGTGTSGFLGDGGPATSALLNGPNGVAFDSTGNLYISDQTNSRIRMVDTSGRITTVAGATHWAGDLGLATGALLHYPQHAIKDPAGNLYISDTSNHAIRKVAPSGTITTIAGNGTCGYTGDQSPAVSATLCYPQALALDSNGNLYVADSSNYVVRRIDTGGLITTYAGNGKSGDSYNGSQATAAQFRYPFGLAVDGAASLYVSDMTSSRVHKIAANGTISLVAGTGTVGYLGDGGSAAAAQLNSPYHLALDGSGSKLYIADPGNSVVRKVEGGIITTVAGTPTCCGTGDATHTYIGAPGGIALDSSGNLYISELTYSYIAKVSGNTLTLIAGNGTRTFAGDGGLATSKSVNFPGGLWVDAAGDVYVADAYNNRIRKLTLDSPTGLAIATGDKQAGTVGTTLNPLVASVGFRAQVPAPGIPVAFAVTSGDAALTASTAYTDATGAAGVGIALGNTPGAVVVTASVTGLSPVQFHLTANAGVPLPVVTSVNSAGDFGGSTSFAPGSWLEIKGSNLAQSTRQWAGGDFSGSNAPTSLDGVTVTIDGNKAFVAYISPSQINVQAPASTATGNVPLVVTTACCSSAAITVTEAATAPGLLAPSSFNIAGKQYLVALFQDGFTYVGNTNLIPGVPFRPAAPGDIVTAYGIGFGPVTPPVSPGVVAGAANSIPNLGISFGSTPATVLYAGLAPGTVGEYQFTFTVPSVANGDYPVTFQLGAAKVPQTVYLTVHQ